MTVWNWATPVLLVLVAAAAIGLLYWTTPNIRQPNFKFVSVGALIAIVVMAIATIGVVLYVTFFGNYDATYGSLAGVIILLFWLYIMNMVLLLGAEVDAELERGKQLQVGIEAERTIMLPARETKGSDKKEKKYEAIVTSGYALRISKGETSSVDDLWRR
ncbi:YihY/virulence factor BrkB family protein [Nesterenkonia pannonica]|uniref:YihY/virulence factor BrkB family protein n=1 Tax=Nesterenkonia pannonica TaxID=1548602 RepID=UPI00216405DD|nr:YihY/virulence factor BrkB family protein [Nesterenkonia pannonica]